MGTGDAEIGWRATARVSPALRTALRRSMHVDGWCVKYAYCRHSPAPLRAFASTSATFTGRPPSRLLSSAAAMKA